MDRPDHSDACATAEVKCFGCHVRDVRIGLPRDFPTKTPSLAEPARPRNDWEAGIPTVKRPGGFEMPFLNEKGNIVQVKEFAEHRHQFEESQRRHHNTPART